MTPAGERGRRPQSEPAAVSTPGGSADSASESSSALTPLWARGPRRVDREAEADALAATVLGSEPQVGRPLRSLHPAPAPDEVEGGADRLPKSVRADFSARFGYDLSEVRFHEAYDGARALGADAFALGRVIAFAPGAFDPTSPQGRTLLAHELAHVVLERGEVPAIASQKATPAPQTFYPDVEEAYQTNWGPVELAIRPVLRLCQVVEAEQATDVKKALDAVEQTDVHRLPPLVPRSSTASELMARLMVLGLPGEAMRLRKWQVSLDRVSRNPTSARRTFDTEAWLTENALGRLRAKVSWSDATAAATHLDAELGIIPVLMAELRGLDQGDVEDDRKRLAANTDPFTQPGFGNQSGDYLTISLWALTLAALVEAAFIDAQAPVQALMDLAASDLAAGRGDATLVELEKRLTVMAALSMPATSLEINTTEYRTKGRKDVLVEVDSWLDQPGARDRQAQLDSYDVEDEELKLFPRPEQAVEPGRIVGLRRAQVMVLKRLYGLQKDKSGTTTAESVENLAAIRTLGKNGLRLHSDDDWRTFLLAKYSAARKTSSPERAFESLLDLLKVYLKAFTTHSPMNIDDFGDNFLTMSFPRALTGQLVHDCGVYALRIAYLLSLLREDPTLKLELRFVQLPVHIGLVITSAAAPIGAYLLHNDAITHYDKAELDGMRAKWDVTDITGNPQPAAPHTAKKDDEFLGELASDAFVPLTDAPYVVTAVPHLTGTPGADKASLWAAYRRTLPTKLFGTASDDPKSPDFQFHLRYLNVLKLAKAHYNQWLVPFWNSIANPAWAANRDALTRADAKRMAARTPDERKAGDAEFAAARAAYLGGAIGKTKRNIEELYTQVRDAYDVVVKESQSITNDVQARPGIIGPAASRASTDRMLEVFDPYIDPPWARVIQRHFQDLKGGLLSSPPYAETKDLIDRVD